MNVFALSLTLMIMVRIKYSAPDSAAKKPGFSKEWRRVVVLLVLLLDPMIEPSLHLEKLLPREENKDHLGHQLSFPKPNLLLS